MKNIRRIIFISGTPISRIVGEKLGLEHYENKGIEIEYWDMTPLYYTQEALNAYFGGHENYRFKFPRETTFYKKRKVNDALRDVSSDTYFCHIDFNQQNDYWLRRCFKRHSIKYYVGPKRTSISFKNGCNTQITKKKIIRKITFSALKRLTIISLKARLNKLIYNFSNYYKKPEFVAGSGLYGRYEWLARTNARCFLSIPSTDLNWEKTPRLYKQDYCVYVDDGVIYSPDQNMTQGIVSTSTNLSEYSNNICQCLDLIEKTLNCKVIVAASGKYHYSDTTIFGKREIIYFQTNQLIQHSKLVVGHASSGLWQAIPDMKPVILLLDPSFTDPKNRAVNNMGSFLAITPIMSMELTTSDIKNSLEVDREYFNMLVDNYFCEKDVEGVAGELIVEKIGVKS